jgi:hypothetical protein
MMKLAGVCETLGHNYQNTPSSIIVVEISDLEFVRIYCVAHSSYGSNPPHILIPLSQQRKLTSISEFVLYVISWTAHAGTSSITDSDIFLDSMFSCNSNLCFSLKERNEEKLCTHICVSLTLTKEHGLRMCESRVLGKICGPKRDEIVRKWRRLNNEELYDL